MPRLNPGARQKRALIFPGMIVLQERLWPQKQWFIAPWLAHLHIVAHNPTSEPIDAQRSGARVLRRNKSNGLTW